MSCICCSTEPESFFAVTKSWGSKADGSTLVICKNCNGVISRSPTFAVLELRRRERMLCAVPLLPDIESVWHIPSAAAIAALATDLQTSSQLEA
jgi:hypothetical protein